MPKDQIPKMKPTNKRVKLDWNKLVGFSQVKATSRKPSTKLANTMIGSKGAIGVKISGVLG